MGSVAGKEENLEIKINCEIPMYKTVRKHIMQMRESYRIPQQQ